MPVFHTLAAIGRFIRRTPPPRADLLEAYAHEVIPVLDRAEWLYEHWLEQSTLFTDSEKLGNVAAIHRWETASMGRSLDRVIPPSVLADAHERVVDALEMASRAAQLLSNGSRFHNANAVCEGQAMLAVSRERRLAALKSMRRHLSHVGPATASPADAASSEPLAGAPAIVSHDANGTPAGELLAAGPTATGPSGDGASTVVDDVAPASAEHAMIAGTADPLVSWPDGAELDLIVTDASEPEPAWLSAARADAAQAATAQAEGVADRPAAEQVPAPVVAGPAEQVAAVEGANGTAEATGGEPTSDPPPAAPLPEPTSRPDDAGSARSDRASWGSLFGGPPRQSG